MGIATDVGRSTTLDPWSSEIGRAFGSDDSPEDLLRILISSHIRMLRQATSAIDLTVLTEVSRRVALSRHVDIYGVGNSALLAEDLQGRLYRIGINAYAWPEVHIGLTSAAIQDAGTVAIGISTSGRTEETIQMLAEAGRAGALTVSISNNPTSPLAELADLSIVTSVHEQYLQPDDLSAKHGQLLVLDLLYLLVAQQNFDRSSAKLAASALAVSSHRRRAATPRQPGPPPTGATPPSTGKGADDDCCPRAGGRLRRPGALAAGLLADMAAGGGLDAAVDLLARAVETGSVIRRSAPATPKRSRWSRRPRRG